MGLCKSFLIYLTLIINTVGFTRIDLKSYQISCAFLMYKLQEKQKKGQPIGWKRLNNHVDKL